MVQSLDIWRVNSAREECLRCIQYRGDTSGSRHYLHITMHDFDGESDALQRYSPDLWNRERFHATLLFPGIELIAYAWFGSACSAATLSCSGSCNPLLF